MKSTFKILMMSVLCLLAAVSEVRSSDGSLLDDLARFYVSANGSELRLRTPCGKLMPVIGGFSGVGYSYLLQGLAPAVFVAGGVGVTYRMKEEISFFGFEYGAGPGLYLGSGCRFGTKWNVKGNFIYGDITSIWTLRDSRTVSLSVNYLLN